MPVDVQFTQPVLVHLDPDDYEEFKKLCGNRRVSMKIRAMIRSELKQHREVRNRA